MEFLGKKVIVTGASSGMGRQIALDFAKEGASVLAVARREERLLALKKEAAEAGYKGEIIPYVADLSKENSTIDMVNKGIGLLKGLDILINNAGSMDNFGPIGELTDETLSKVLNIDLLSPLYSTREACKYWLENSKPGNIVNIASIAGLGGGKAGAAYTMAKHAIIGLTKNTGYQYRNSGIRCNAIAPGGIATEIMGPESFATISQFGYANIKPMTAMNIPTGSVNQISDVALFLASDKSSYINGVILPVDGGIMAS